MWLRPIGLVRRSAATGAVLHSSREPSKLSQCSKYDDSTVNIVQVLLLYNYYFERSRSKFKVKITVLKVWYITVFSDFGDSYKGLDHRFCLQCLCFWFLFIFLFLFFFLFFFVVLLLFSSSSFLSSSFSSSIFTYYLYLLILRPSLFGQLPTSFPLKIAYHSFRFRYVVYFRLPVILGGSFLLLTPALSILALPQWTCPGKMSLHLLFFTLKCIP